jgi:hypothetical protein
MSGAVFDLHQHVGGIEGMKALGKFSAAFPATDEAIATDQEYRLEAMALMGIDQAAIMPTHSYQRPNGLKDTCAVHDALIRYRAMNPERFPALFGTMEPRYGEDGLDEIDRIARLGFQGISWHNRFQGLPVDHPVMHSFILRSHAVGLVPLIHCIVSDFEAVWRLRVLAERMPDGIFICADGLTNADNFDAVIATAEACPNIYFDTTTSVVGSGGVERFVERISAERLLMGTNLYSGSRRPITTTGLDNVREARLSDEDRALILGGNTRRLLGLAN